MDEKMKKNVIVLAIVVVLLYVYSSIVPALLSASNDLAVLIGVAIIVGTGVVVTMKWSNIVEFVKGIFV